MEISAELLSIKPREMRHSNSYADVQTVAAESSTRVSKTQYGVNCTLLEKHIKAVQEHENDIAEVVIVCEPEGSSLTMGGLHPRASLYERPINIDSAKRMHADFRRVLREMGVKVLTVREVLAYGVAEHVGARMDLEDLAAQMLNYDMGPGVKVEDFEEEERRYLGDAYKREVVEHMSVNQLIDTVLINPTVTLNPSYRDTGFTASYTFDPLANLVYTRDQQITTCKGIIMGRLRAQQRQREVNVMRFCFNKLGLPVVGCIEDPGFLEGGDFFPVGQELAMLGIGLRSNMEAARQLMDQDLLGSRRFAVVRDDFDKHQDRMHLDCVFSVLSDDCCIMLESIMGETSPTRRLVDEYARDSASGTYRLVRESVEFATYMRQEGFSIISISHDHQLKYACNILNLGESRIISVHPESARQIVKSPHFKGDARVIDFSSITSMYGSVHCASQVLKRKSARGAQTVSPAPLPNFPRPPLSS